MKLSEISEFSVIELTKSLPELPWVKRDRYVKDYGMTDKEVAVFIESPEIAVYFDAVISGFKNDAKRIKLAINYILSEYLGLLKKLGIAIPSKSFAEVIELIASGDISSRGAKDLLSLLINESVASKNGLLSVKSLAEKRGLIQKSDAASLVPAIEKVIADNPKVVAEYKAGKTASLQYLIGQAMKATRGAGNPEVVKKLLLEKLS